MSRALRVLIVTDSFPPVCGGSGWSTWELAKGLVARGHDIHVVKVEIAAAAGVSETSDGPFPISIFRVQAPNVPVVRNVLKNERLWRSLRDYLVATRLSGDAIDVIHSQHVMTTVPSIRAGLATGVPVVATVRDYWPVCYWSDLIYDPSQSELCPACTVGNMTACIRPRAGAAAVAAWPLIPYMRRNLRTKRQTLAQASAIIAVSSTIARDLRTRAPEISGTPFYTIPNPVDMTALDRAWHTSAPPLPEPYLLYVGKLATNKGVQYLLPATADIHWPLVIVGDGPMRAALEADARASRRDIRFIGWQDREVVWSWMRHAGILAFPSYGPESLSRVLIEAAALGAPIAAMNTGGTPDIIRHQVTGLLAADAHAFARALADLANDDAARARLGSAARRDVHTRFSADSVVQRVEAVYFDVTGREAA